MAFGDIVILNPDTAPVDQYPLNASETFDAGEFVQLATDGQVAEAADEATTDAIIGVSAAGGDTTATASSATGIGIFKYSTIGDFVPGSNAAAENDYVPVYLFVPQTKFATRNFATDGAGTDAAPTVANAMGEQVEATVVAGVHGVDTNSATADNAFALITDVLDANMTPIQLSGGTGVWVVFRATASRLNPVDPA